MSLLTIILFFVGIGLLVWGADTLVRGAAFLAAVAGIPPLIIGLTVVALGTSSPELAVSLQAALGGKADLTLGNVVGSNIANVLLILGLTAIVAPLLVAPQLLRREVPAMIGVSLLLWLLAADGSIGRFDGLLMVMLLVGFMTAIVWTSRRKEAPAPDEPDNSPAPERSLRAVAYNLGLVVVGLLLLVVGAQWLVDGAVSFARVLGLSELIIGLTVVAVGTSLPEIATSMLASYRGQRDIAVGNVVGSNIINILGVLGIAALITPQPINVPAGALAFDLPVMVAASIACLPIFFNGQMVARWEGALFLAYYIAYTVYLILMATHSTALGLFSTAMLFFAIPLTAITILVVTFQSLQRRRQSA